jgi:hypothetical protein
MTRDDSCTTRHRWLAQLAPAVLGILLALTPASVLAEVIEIGAGDNFCAALERLQPGDDLRIAPGDYPGPCRLRRGGLSDRPIVIQAADPERRPRIIYDGETADVLWVSGNHITIRGLEFGPTRQDVDAIRIFSGSAISIEDCLFSELGGIAIAANHLNVRGLVVRQNTIRQSRSTGMYFGCHDGSGCSITGLTVEGNLIHTVRAPDPQIGYGIEIKLNSAGIVRNNVIMDTKGPGIMVYGSLDQTQTTLVERNVVTGSRTSSGIVVGGGPAIIRNNLAVEHSVSGIGLEDYHRRGLLREIVIAHNTLYQAAAPAIALPERGIRRVTILNNAVHSRPGTLALPSARAGLTLLGNIDCSVTVCFANPLTMDFAPLETSILRHAGFISTESWVPRDDLLGQRRATPPTVGAVEGPGRPTRIPASDRVRRTN